MEAQVCSSIRDSLLSFFGTELEVSTFEDQCIITLPLKTLDDRFLDVYVEPSIGDYVVVHDGGRTASELHAQGIHLTDKKRAILQLMASRYDAVFDGEDDKFKIGSKGDAVQPAILAIAQCASLAMYDVLGHSPVIEAEPIRARVRRSLDSWQTQVFQIEHRVHIRGATSGAHHFFDSVAFPKENGRRTVAVKVLTPGYGPQVQADRYGFLALDIKQTTPYSQWPRVAVISKAEQWVESALQIVRTFSDHTLTVTTGDDERVGEALPKRIEELSKTA